MTTVALLLLASSFSEERCGQFAPEVTTYEFGEVKASVHHVNGKIPYRNAGKVPMLIQQTNTNTGAMVAWTTKQPIPPGKTDTIYFTLDVSHKAGQQQKYIYVRYNDSCHTVLTVKGSVIAAPPENVFPPPKSSGGEPVNPR